jgi:ABC-type antimicrobial peptide transport system permease subunit
MEDPATFLTVTIAVAAVASIACAVPAWRAARIDPIKALRSF